MQENRLICETLLQPKTGESFGFFALHELYSWKQLKFYICRFQGKLYFPSK